MQNEEIHLDQICEDTWITTLINIDFKVEVTFYS